VIQYEELNIEQSNIGQFLRRVLYLNSCEECKELFNIKQFYIISCNTVYSIKRCTSELQALLVWLSFHILILTVNSSTGLSKGCSLSILHNEFDV
jgi:hypothetical protein